MPKKRASHLFLKITCFCSLLLLLTPEILPNHLFRQTNDQKWSKKLPKGEKKISFFLIYFTFSLSSHGKKTKPHTFSALFVTGNRKTARENVPLKICLFFFFFFFYFLHPTVPRNRKNYHLPFFSKFRLKVSKTSAKRAQVSYLTNYLFPAVITRTHTPFQTHSVFPNHNAEKTRLTPFSENYFFLLSTPSRYPRNTS